MGLEDLHQPIPGALGSLPALRAVFATAGGEAFGGRSKSSGFASTLSVVRSFRIPPTAQAFP